MPLALDVDDALLSSLEEQFRLHSDRPAVKTESIAWNYSELDALSANCARSIREQSQNGSAPVALLMKHDAPLVAAIVGVLRSGGFYLALNPAFPGARLRQIVNEIRPRAIIADPEHEEIALELIGSKERRLVIDELLAGEGSFSAPAVAATAPCALFYTSGSAMRPKPLVYRHGGTWRSVINHARLLRITPEDRVTLLSPCSAAASVLAMFGALLNGACLFPFQPALEGFRAMEGWIRDNRITIYHSVPSLFRHFAQSLAPGDLFPTVRIVKLGGETVFATDVELFRKHFMSDAVFVNGLGLTEANGCVCHFCLTQDITIKSATVPIGRPDDGIELKLFDNDCGEGASGEIGEIALRGKQIAPAYWTGSAIQPYALDGSGWFRTGDLARQKADGTLEYLGRKDGQLKLRGQWISISEIEAILTRVHGVKDAVVVPVAISKREERIAAFVCWGKPELSKQDLRNALSKQLPPFSVPSYFFRLAQFPLLPNGKVDRRALSYRAGQKLISETRIDSSDSVTRRLIQIWRSVLEDDSIGTTDDFFISGGDSLAAATMLSAVEKVFRVSLPASSLLAAPTVEKLAQRIRRGVSQEVGSHLVAVQPCGTKPPLYCVPAAGADPLQFRLLACHLGDDQPLFAFQPQGLNSPIPFHRSVEEIAADYVALLRRHQPQGPYHVCGSSFGGLVAFEMAKRLLEVGQKVRFLGLFDTYNVRRYPKLRGDLSVLQRLWSVTRKALPSRADRVSWKAAKWWLKVNAVRCYVRANRRPLLARPHHWRSLYFREICYAAGSRYHTKSIPIRIHLFRVEDQPSAEFYDYDPLLGWDGMAGKGIEVHALPGKHAEIVTTPSVMLLAQKLRLCLSQG